jgi:hypothetical protein
VHEYKHYAQQTVIFDRQNKFILYTKEEASLIRQSFWKAFGQYMALHTSAEGLKINWINYKTGIKYLSFKMQADNKSGMIMIEMSHPDASIRLLMFEQFLALKKMFNEAVDEEWDWEQDVQDEYGRTVSRISKAISGVNIFKQDDWPALISFFKPRMIALDNFWSSAQYGFDLFK